jgi:hypothetical protein
MLLVEVTQVREVATAIEVAQAAAMLTVEAPLREAVVVQDSVALCVKDAEDWTALSEREALERV